MNIKRSTNAKTWLDGFENDTLESNCLAPGIAKNIKDFLKYKDQTHWMCGIEAADILTQLFGAPDGKVSGKVKKADVLCFEFEGHTIAAMSEKSFGTSWHLFTGNAGSRYERYMYNSCDAEVVDFIPRFFEELAEAYQNLNVTKTDSFSP